jgi:hypothetical protein
MKLPGNGPPEAVKKSRIREAVVLWQLMTVGAIALIGSLIIWHLKRRGDLVKSKVSPPKMQSSPMDWHTLEGP